MDFKITQAERHDDKRGKMIILLKKNDLPNNLQVFGEVFFITFSRKGIIRANHYHKKWREWFIIISGKILVIIENVKTKKRFETILDGNQNRVFRLEIGPYIAHAFRNLSRKAILINYTNIEWSADDTHYHKLI